jgi:AcrR family transcriptional regulator
MTTRAAAAQATRERILDAALDLFIARPYDDVGMREIAAAAGVSPQTVVNHFGTKEALFLAGARERYKARTAELRYAVPIGDIEAAAAALAADYEDTLDTNMRLLAIEERVPTVPDALEEGRKFHREWVERTFPAALEGLSGVARHRRLARLAVAADISTWRLLRRDHGLTVKQATLAVRESIEAIHHRGDEPARGAP